MAPKSKAKLTIKPICKVTRVGDKVRVKLHYYSTQEQLFQTLISQSALMSLWAMGNNTREKLVNRVLAAVYDDIASKISGNQMCFTLNEAEQCALVVALADCKQPDFIFLKSQLYDRL